MLGRRLLLLGILLSCGIALVWLFGVRENESLFSGARRVAASSSKEPSTSATAPKQNPSESASGGSTAPTDSASTAMAYSNAKIPVREAMPGRPDVKVMKYLITLGSSDGAVGRRLHARGVAIEIYNKQLEPNSKMIAIVKGDTAELEFRDPPDPKTGFRDNPPMGMSLTGKNKVDYLNDAGTTIATLENEHLNLSDAKITGPGANKITMQGLTITGDDLTYDRTTGEMLLEHNIKIAGKRFALPSRKVDPTQPVEPPKDDSNVPEKVITCDGPFTFQPTKSADKEKTKASSDLSMLVAGGLMTFHGNVVATQGDASRLDSEDLEVTLEQNKKPATVPGPDPTPNTTEAAIDASQGENLKVTRTFARGTPNKQAVLHDARGTFKGETLLDETKDDGPWVTLSGNPTVDGAQLGADNSSGGAAPSDSPKFDAAASRQIRMRPAPVDASAVVQGPKLTLVELDGDATLHRSAGVGEDELLLHADQIEMRITPASGETKSSLSKLVAHGNANGTMERGTFKGDQITLTPREGSTDPNAMQLEIVPNPSVDLSLGADDAGGAERRAKFTSLGESRLLWLPPLGEGVPAKASFFGPQHLDMFEGETLTTTLDAKESMVIEFVSTNDKQSISQLVAKGDVQFDSKANKTTGSGAQMTLIPEDQGPGKLKLLGAPAVATLINEDGSKQTIRAATINYDPETGAIDAAQSVDVDMGALALGGQEAAGDPSQGTPKPPSGAGSKLYCDRLNVRQEGEGEQKATIVEAFDSVVIDDPTNGAHATASHFVYDESKGIAHLFGDASTDATATRKLDPTSLNSVTIIGPELLLNSASNGLTCQRNGHIEMVQPLVEGSKETSVVKAQCTGPIRFADNKLELNNDVVVRFEESGTEVRSVWSDHATVYFDESTPTPVVETTPKESPAPKPAANAPTSGGMGKFKEMLAEGRVHLTQTAPRELEADGQSLRWKIVDGVETMFLYGSSPKCWVKGLSVNKHLRYEADSFVILSGSQAFTAENGRFVYDPEVLQR